MRNATWILAVMAIAGAAVRAQGAPPPTSQPAVDDATEFDRSQHYAGARTQENLDRIRKALAAPQSRMAAVRELIDFAGESAYPVGSVFLSYPDGSGELRLQATKAADASADDATILKAIGGSDPVLVFWGLWHFQELKDPQASLPLLGNIAQGHDETLRAQAAEMLRTQGESAFVRQLARTEKSPYVLDELLFMGNPTGAAAFNRRLCDLLKDADPAVRKETVDWISANWIAAASRQIFIDASLMDGLLGCAQAGHPEAGAALDAFRTCADQKDLADAAAASKWWNTHRSDWELARFPRWQQPNGGEITASIVTTGEVGGTPGWQASIILENRSRRDAQVDLAEVAALNWDLFDGDGKRVADDKPRQVAPNWVDLRPGQSVTQVSPIALQAGASLKPGRYTLHAWLHLGAELPLPAITVEVSDHQN